MLFRSGRRDCWIVGVSEVDVEADTGLDCCLAFGGADGAGALEGGNSTPIVGGIKGGACKGLMPPPLSDVEAAVREEPRPNFCYNRQYFPMFFANLDARSYHTQV